MKIWNHARGVLRNWLPATTRAKRLPEDHLFEAHRNLRELLEDTDIPASVRDELEAEFNAIEALSEKLESREIHIAVFGRVGTGKSSLLNALSGLAELATHVLHGQTRVSQALSWRAFEHCSVKLIDTPGIDELDGEERERIAKRTAEHADLVVFVCASDLTTLEFQAVRYLASRGRPLLLVLNKSDLYSKAELIALLDQLKSRCKAFLSPDRVLAVSSDPRAETVILVHEDGSEVETRRERQPDISSLEDFLWHVVTHEAQTLVALNAALVASELDSQVAQKIVAARQNVAERVIRGYCLAKGLAVAANPIPLADLLAAAGVDVSLVIHLGQVYGYRLSKREASRLLLTIAAQLVALMGAYWGVNLVSSAMKGFSGGLSTAVTAAAQGALAWYATYVTGQIAQSWFARGKSWGDKGPRETARDIVTHLDRDSILATAREEILAMLTARKQV